MLTWLAQPFQFRQLNVGSIAFFRSVPVPPANELRANCRKSLQDWIGTIDGVLEGLSLDSPQFIRGR
jgi:hypothetical protein